MIEKLLMIQRIDLEIDEIRHGAKTYPEKLARCESDYNEKKKLLEAAQFQLEGLERERFDLEDSLKLEEQRLKKSKARLNEIKTNYEFQAMRREIESTEHSNKELEDQALKKVEEIEGLKNKIEEYRMQFDSSQKELTQIKDEVALRTSEFDGVIKTKVQEQENLEKEIDRSLLGRYRLIRQRKHRDALVEVIEGACQGCFMNVPPQMTNEILRQGVGIYQCPNCQRLLYCKVEKT